MTPKPDADPSFTSPQLAADDSTPVSIESATADQALAEFAEEDPEDDPLLTDLFDPLAVIVLDDLML